MNMNKFLLINQQIRLHYCNLARFSQTSLTLFSKTSIIIFALLACKFATAQQGVGNYVWLDSNEDGVQNPTEKGLSQVTVTLYDINNHVVAVTRTDAFGAYFFNNIPVGDYKVRVNTPFDYTFSPKNVSILGGNTTTDSDINPSGYSDVFTLLTNTNNNDIDAGLHFEKSDIAYINSYVWLDADANGIQDVGERGMANVGVMLLNSAGNIVQSTLSDGNGYYQLSTYTSGNYQVAFRLPLGYTFTGKNVIGSTPNNDSDINNNGIYFGQTDIVSLSLGNTLSHIDAGLISSNMASIGSFVWNDLNHDGIQNSGEPGIANVSVILKDTNNAVIANTSTDAFGQYSFTQIPMGIYYVYVGNPAGFVFSQTETGNGNNDSDINPMTGNSEWFVVTAGARLAHIDAGMYEQFTAGSASLGNLLWFDHNQNGIQELKEDGIAGVTVFLYDAIGSLIQSTITDEMGFYTFSNLVAGTYSIEFINLPKGFVFTRSHIGSAITDNDAERDGRIYNIVLAANAARTDIDAGVYLAGAQIGKGLISNSVWNDINGDGIQDTGEAGMKEIDVILYASDGTTILATTTTDGDGKYVFHGLTKGKYFVEFTNLPANFSFVNQYSGTNQAIDSDVNPLGKTDAIFVGQGENITDIDAGVKNVITTGQISNFVWYDGNNNGIQNTGELGVPNISVTLYDNNNVVIATTLTDEMGYYVFPNVPAGTYYVGFSNLPAGYALGLQLQGGNTNTDSDPNPITGLTNTFSLIANQNKNNVDAAVVTSRSMIGNYVWYDQNRNGIQDFTEKGIEGVTVTLYNNLNNLIASTITTEKGEYYFSNLNSGQYILGYTTFYEDLLFTTKDTIYAGSSNNNDSDINPATGLTDVFTLSTKTINLSFDAGLMCIDKGSINGYAWDDTNEDGIQDATEQAVAGILVTLYAFDGVSIMSNTVTDANGKYIFSQINSVDYVLGFTSLPDNYTFTEIYQGANISLDNDVDKDGSTGTFSLSGGENIEGADAGIMNRNITIGDFVFDDKDQDGIMDDTESGVADVTVTLYNGLGEILAVTKTDAYGRYGFRNQALGDYEVGFSLPVDYVFTIPNMGGSKDSDASPITGKTGVFSISYEEDTFDIDAGIYFPETVLSSIGNYVWFDANSNGLQDANEKGMSNITVMLLDNSNHILLSTLTDQRGFYQFLDIPAGTYSVALTLPSGYTYTVANIGINDALDSDYNTTLGHTDPITLAVAEKQNKWDIGLRKLLVTRPDVGDRVWNDLNQNGIQEADELGVAGVLLSLYDNNNTLLATTKTDVFGNYLFANIVQGLYKITLSLPSGWSLSPIHVGNSISDNDFGVNGNSTATFVLSEGDKITDIDAGIFQNSPAGTSAIGDRIWSDVNLNGLQDTQEPGIAGITVVLYNNLLSPIDSTTSNINGDFRFVGLAAGTYYLKFINLPEGLYFTTKDADGLAGYTTDSDVNEATAFTDAITLVANNYDATIDVGLISQSANSGKASIGNRVWYDRNANGVYDADEAGVANVQVTLTDLSNNATTIIKTDGLGNYIFNNLAAGNYKIAVVLPSGYTFSPQNATTADIDSDINPMISESGIITLAQGESNVTVDAGIYQNIGTASLGKLVWNDTDNDGVQDAGEPGMPGVTVTLYDATLTAISTTSTDVYGKYLFANLPAGFYTLGFSNLPEGFVFSLKDQNNNDNTDSDVRPNMAITAPFQLSIGASKMNMAAGLHSTTRATIGDYVWYDSNNDGLQGLGELPVVGATVIVYDGGSNEISKSVTDDAGHYHFSNLYPGSYWIGFRTLALGARLTTYHVGGGANSAFDSDANASGLTDELIMAAGSVTMEVDGGIGTSASVGIYGYAWYDYQDISAATNNNGLQDASEKPAVGVSVGLYPGTSATLLATAITDANGMYYFEGLTTGSYRIKINALPLNTRIALQDQGNDAIDSDIDPVFLQSPAYTATLGQNVHAADIGLIPPAAITGTAFTDGQLNVLGSADGFQNYQIPTNNTTPADSGIKAVSVILIDALTGNVVRNSYTLENGDYFFRNLDPNNNYIVAFEEFPTHCPTCPYTFYNADNNVNDSTDSDANQSIMFNYAGKNHAYSDVINALMPMQLRKNVDVGYALLGSILPAKLLDLTAVWQDIDGLLTWQTSEETNTDFFGLERSLDGGQSFVEIGKVKAAGNSMEMKSYKYLDANIGNVSQSEIYYRLHIMDTEGNEDYSDIVSLHKNELSAMVDMDVYPNPTQDIVNINYQVVEAGKITFILSNELGQLLDEKVYLAKDRPLLTSFNLKKYPSGKYYIQMRSPTGVIAKVVIKE